jgi:hypothetical protein
VDFLPQLALGATIISAVWGHAIWLSTRFSSIQKEIDTKFEKILTSLTTKMEYHERHDDRRFSQISDGLWEIRLQSAIHSGARLDVKAKKSTSGDGGEEDSSGERSS